MTQNYQIRVKKKLGVTQKGHPDIKYTIPNVKYTIPNTKYITCYLTLLFASQFFHKIYTFFQGPRKWQIWGRSAPSPSTHLCHILDSITCPFPPFLASRKRMDNESRSELLMYIEQTSLISFANLVAWILSCCLQLWLGVFDISISHIDYRYIDTFWKYRYR